MAKNLQVKWNTMRHLRNPTRTKLPRNFAIGIKNINSSRLATALWDGNKFAAAIEISFAPYGLKREHTIAEFNGGTSKNYRQKGIGTWYRALLTKAVLNSGVNMIVHSGVNKENLAAKALAKREGISLQMARNHKNFMPLSTRIMRKLGYTPSKRNNGSNSSTGSVMLSTNNRTKLNNVIRKINSKSPRRNKVQ